MQRAGFVGQRVVILAARQVQQVAGAHGDVHQDLALGVVVVGLAIVPVTRVGDRQVGAGLVDLPDLLAFQMSGVDVVGIEVGVEGLTLAPGAVDIGLGLAAQGGFQCLGDGPQARAQCVAVVGDQGGALTQ